MGDAYPRLADDECHTSAMPVLTDWSGSDWANAIYEGKKANPSKCTVRFFYDGEMSAEYLFQEFELDINKGYTVGKSEGDLPKSLKYEQLNLNWDSGNLQAMENAPTGVQCTGCPDDTILVLFDEDNVNGEKVTLDKIGNDYFWSGYDQFCVETCKDGYAFPDDIYHDLGGFAIITKSQQGKDCSGYGLDTH